MSGGGRQEAEHARGGAEAAPPARNPNVAEAPAAREEFHGIPATVTVAPDLLSVPFQTWVMAWPSASLQVAFQWVIAVLPTVTVTVTSPRKPLRQDLIVL